MAFLWATNWYPKCVWATNLLLLLVHFALEWYHIVDSMMSMRSHRLAWHVYDGARLLSVCVRTGTHCALPSALLLLCSLSLCGETGRLRAGGERRIDARANWYRCVHWLLYKLNRENWINRWIQFHQNEWTVIIHSSATVIQFSIQQFFKRTYALNKWAPLPMGNISVLVWAGSTSSLNRWF